MTITLELVVVIFLIWLQLRNLYMAVIFGLPYSNISLRALKNVHHVRYFRGKNVPTQIHFIPLSSSSPLQNGSSILCNVSLPQLGGTIISSLSSIISLNGLRLWIHSLTMATLQHFLCSITSSLNSVCQKIL
jgi:hypothetical protein